MTEPSWSAQMDQMLAGVLDLAKITATYYRELNVQGVPADIAGQMASALGVGIITAKGDE